jgi:hypothetical protein
MQQQASQKKASQPQFVSSLFDRMQEGKEYQSIVGARVAPGVELLDDVVRGLVEIEQLRKRPCLMYVGNVVKNDGGLSSLDSSDDLPFREMVAQVASDQRTVDIFLATRGGLAHQVSNFVNCLRDRFDEVHFVIPSFCMSAGTLFALSGDTICMTDRACLGPIDPQVQTAAGRYVPAQALMVILGELQRLGDEALAAKKPLPWAYVRAIDSLDKKELGEAITASRYAETMAARFLQNFKFRNWTVRTTSNAPVTEEYKAARAAEIAAELVKHDRWMNHGHSISRDVLASELRLRIEHPDNALNRAIARLWAVCTYVIDTTPIVKLICSSQYRYVRFQTAVEKDKP